MDRLRTRDSLHYLLKLAKYTETERDDQDNVTVTMHQKVTPSFCNMIQLVTRNLANKTKEQLATLFWHRNLRNLLPPRYGHDRQHDRHKRSNQETPNKMVLFNSPSPKVVTSEGIRERQTQAMIYTYTKNVTKQTTTHRDRDNSTEVAINNNTIIYNSHTSIFTRPTDKSATRHE